jgi:hypothetical protein
MRLIGDRETKAASQRYRRHASSTSRVWLIWPIGPLRPFADTPFIPLTRAAAVGQQARHHRRGKTLLGHAGTPWDFFAGGTPGSFRELHIEGQKDGRRYQN